ncbi:MAG: 30S ribosomal protein S7 [Myxococcota bacterium]
MSRRRISAKRPMVADPKFGSKRLAKFINVLMIGGKKSTAESVVYGAFVLMEKQGKESPLKVFEQALENVKPAVEVRPRRVGGANYQVPTEVAADRRFALAYRWLRDCAKKRGERDMKQRLAGELLDAYAGQGAACKKKDDTHRMAEANKAFAHYRFGKR